MPQVLIYDLAADYMERRGPYYDGHKAHLAAAAGRGELVLAGAWGAPPAGVMFVFPEDGRAEAFAAADPYVAGGVATAWRVEPWYPILPG